MQHRLHMEPAAFISYFVQLGYCTNKSIIDYPKMLKFANIDVYKYFKRKENKQKDLAKIKRTLNMLNNAEFSPLIGGKKKKPNRKFKVN